MPKKKATRRKNAPVRQRTACPATGLKRQRSGGQRTRRNSMVHRKTVEEMIKRRETVMRKIEEKTLELSEAMQEWTSGLDSATAHLSQMANGPLMTELTEAMGFSDKSCVKTFTKGAPILKKRYQGPQTPCLANTPKQSLPNNWRMSAKKETRHCSRH